MNIKAEPMVTVVTVTLTEREAKLLCLLVGSMPPKSVVNFIENGYRYQDWIGSLDDREVITFTGEMYDGLYTLF